MLPRSENLHARYDRPAAWTEKVCGMACAKDGSLFRALEPEIGFHPANRRFQGGRFLFTMTGRGGSGRWTSRW